MENNHEISVEVAQAMLDSFKNSPLFMNQTRGVFFNNQTILELINLPNSIGIDFYFGLNDQNLLTLILISRDINNNEISTKILDLAYHIPPYVPVNSPFIL